MKMCPLFSKTKKKNGKVGKKGAVNIFSFCAYFNYQINHDCVRQRCRGEKIASLTKNNRFALKSLLF